MSAHRVIFASPPPPPPWNAPRRRRTCRPARARVIAPVLYGLGEGLIGRGERTTTSKLLPGPLHAAQAALRSTSPPTAASRSSSSAPGSDMAAGPSFKRSSQPLLQRPASVEEAARAAPKTKRLPWTKPERRPRPPPTVDWAIDPAHRLPTLWGLYRDLLRVGRKPEYAELGRYVREQFREKRVATDAAAAADDLRRGYELLNELQTQAGVDRIVGRLHAYYGKQAARLALSMPFRHRHTGGRIPGARDTTGQKTGGIFQATKFNPPMPMMKPQPHNVSMMIFRRREAYVKASRLLDLSRDARQAPVGSDLRSILDDHDFRTRLDSARQTVATCERRVRQSPSAEMVVELLPFIVRRERWAAARRARGEYVKEFGSKEEMDLMRERRERDAAEARAGEIALPRG